MCSSDKQRLRQFLCDLKRLFARDWQLIAFFVGLPFILSVPLYYVEHNEANAKIHHISEAIYVTWITLTTVGYGDLYPITWWGRAIASIDAGFGIVMFGLIVYYVTQARED